MPYDFGLSLLIWGCFNTTKVIVRLSLNKYVKLSDEGFKEMHFIFEQNVYIHFLQKFLLFLPEVRTKKLNNSISSSQQADDETSSTSLVSSSQYLSKLCGIKSELLPIVDSNFHISAISPSTAAGGDAISYAEADDTPDVTVQDDDAPQYLAPPARDTSPYSDLPSSSNMQWLPAATDDQTSPTPTSSQELIPSSSSSAVSFPFGNNDDRPTMVSLNS